MTTTTRLALATRSMAPPMPLTIFPGIIQLARLPWASTCMAPRIDRSIWPPRIMAKLSALLKKLAPGAKVTVCLPALIRSASTSSGVGKGPRPSRPFSLCSTTSMPSGIAPATRVGMPMPRFT